MNRLAKALSALTILFFVTTSNLFALGAGVQAGVTPAFDIKQNETSFSEIDGTLVGTFRLFRIPAVFGFGLSAGSCNSQFNAGVTGFFDYWLLDCQIKNTFNLYAGAGLTAGMNFGFKENSQSVITAGPRLFTGLNWLFLDNYIEYYVQTNIFPAFAKPLNSSDYNFRLSVPVETGVRLHF